jgi:hypothetical protein
MTIQWDSLGLGGPEPAFANHVCAFFHSLDERYRVLLPFIKQGLERGEKAVHIVNPDVQAEHLRRLEDAGIPVTPLVDSGQLEVWLWTNAYVHDGHFNPDAKLAFIEGVLERSKREGYPFTRLIGEIEWEPEDRPNEDALIEYEVRLNYLLSGRNDQVVCVYEVARFSAGVLLDFLRTHPILIIDEAIHVNPFFVPPGTFLREIRSTSRDGGDSGTPPRPLEGQ